MRWGIPSIRCYLSLLLVAVLTGLAARPVAAHSAVLWAEVGAGGSVHVEAYFSDGSRVQGARIVVRDADGEPILQGATDSNGELDFVLPKVQDLTVVLEVDQVHADSVHIPQDAFQNGALAR